MPSGYGEIYRVVLGHRLCYARCEASHVYDRERLSKVWMLLCLFAVNGHFAHWHLVKVIQRLYNAQKKNAASIRVECQSRCLIQLSNDSVTIFSHRLVGERGQLLHNSIGNLRASSVLC